MKPCPLRLRHGLAPCHGRSHGGTALPHVTAAVTAARPCPMSRPLSRRHGLAPCHGRCHGGTASPHVTAPSSDPTWHHPGALALRDGLGGRTRTGWGWGWRGGGSAHLALSSPTWRLPHPHGACLAHLALAPPAATTQPGGRVGTRCSCVGSSAVARRERRGRRERSGPPRLPRRAQAVRVATQRAPGA